MAEVTGSQPNSRCETEESFGGPVFEPRLYIQRYYFVQQQLIKHRVTSVIDFGCAECKLSRFLVRVPTTEKVALVDVDRGLLERCRSAIRPEATDFLERRERPLTVQVYCGSVTELDAAIVGYDAVSMVEIIEHLYPDTLSGAVAMVFGALQPRIVVMTTPNAEFNVLFPGFSGFRHYDHKFEWTRQEFQQWCSAIVDQYPYTVEFDGIGDPPEASKHQGHCSQAAIFVRNSDVQKSEYKMASDTYQLVAESTYPHKQVSGMSEEEVMLMELQYLIRQHGQTKNSSSTDMDHTPFIPCNGTQKCTDKRDDSANVNICEHCTHQICNHCYHTTCNSCKNKQCSRMQDYESDLIDNRTCDGDSCGVDCETCSCGGHYVKSKLEIGQSKLITTELGTDVGAIRSCKLITDTDTDMNQKWRTNCCNINFAHTSTELYSSELGTDVDAIRSCDTITNTYSDTGMNKKWRTNTVNTHSNTNLTPTSSEFYNSELGTDVDRIVNYELGTDIDKLVISDQDNIPGDEDDVMIPLNTLLKHKQIKAKFDTDTLREFLLNHGFRLSQDKNCVMWTVEYDESVYHDDDNQEVEDNREDLDTQDRDTDRAEADDAHSVGQYSCSDAGFVAEYWD